MKDDSADETAVNFGQLEMKLKKEIDEKKKELQNKKNKTYEEEDYILKLKEENETYVEKLSVSQLKS